MSKTRQSFSAELKREIAQGYASKTLSSKEIEARGIRMGNVHRWVHQFVGDKAKPPPATAALETAATIAPELRDIRTLSKRELKRGPGGRYSQIVKDSAAAALKTMSIGEVAAITGINAATLYLWRSPAAKKKASPGTALVAAAVVEHGNGKALVSKADLLINPESTDGLLDGIRKMEGFVNFTKAVEAKIKKFRAGLIDFDEDDHLLCRAYLQITGGKPGGGLRSRK